MKEKFNIKLRSHIEVIQTIPIQGRNQTNQCYQPESLCLEKTAEHKAPLLRSFFLFWTFFPIVNWKKNKIFQTPAETELCNL